MKLLRYVSVIALLGASAAPSFGAGPEDLLGVWNNQEKDARIEMYRCQDQYCGRIVWLKDPNYPAGSSDGTPGTPKADHHNPDPARRGDPIIGLVIVKDMRYDGEGRLADGTVYDPKNGKTYRGKMTLIAPGRLDLRGYVGISLFGRTTTWTR